MATQATQRRIDAEALSIIEGLANEGRTAPNIEVELEARGIPPARRPSRRTIERIVKSLTAEDRSPPWGLGDLAASEDAALVLPVVRAYLNITSMRAPARSPRDFYITRAEARWIIRVRRAAPDLHVFDVYRMARAYLAREVRRLPTFDLDALLAFEPWNEHPISLPVPDGAPELTSSHREQYSKGIREGWIPAAPAFLMRELAGVEWKPSTKREWDLWVRTTIAHDPEAYGESAISEEVDDAENE